ncbi:MAG: LemA family protein [Piscinibacter sp.]|nr:LemA family protein [Piscinibacter sp.]
MPSLGGREIAALAVVAMLGFWLLGAHNRLVRLRQGIGAAFAQVDTHLRQRHALLAELIAAAGAGLDDAPEALDAIEAARQQARVAADRVAQRPASAGRLASLVLAEQVLRTAVSRLFTLARTRPALRGDARLRAAMAELSATQHRLAAARDAFNAEVLGYNASVRQFPTRVVAGLFGFRAAGTL